MTQEITEEVVVQVEQPQAEVTTEVKEAEKPQENSQDHNWKEANRVLKDQQKRIQELEATLNEKLRPAPVQEEPDEFADLDPNDYLTVDKARKFAEKLAEKKAVAAAKKIVHEYAQQQNVQSDELRARSKYNDYDYVVENFAIPLIKNDPALAYKIQQSKNPAETAYKLGKLSDAYEEQVETKQVSPKAEKILKNANRPLSGNAVSQPLKNQAADFSKLSQQEIWEMSQKYARGAI